MRCGRNIIWSHTHTHTRTVAFRQHCTAHTISQIFCILKKRNNFLLLFFWWNFRVDKYNVKYTQSFASTVITLVYNKYTHTTTNLNSVRGSGLFMYVHTPRRTVCKWERRRCGVRLCAAGCILYVSSKTTPWPCNTAWYARLWWPRNYSHFSLIFYLYQSKIVIIYLWYNIYFNYVTKSKKIHIIFP